MYYVHDLYDDTVVKSGTMQEVANWWRAKQERKNFTQLNVTGKDTYVSRERDGWMFLPRISATVPTYITVTYLRRYQVLDKDGRSVDIRNWPKSVWEWAPSYPPCYWPCGFKDNHHRTTGPSMWRGTYRASMDGLDETELLSEDLPLPIRDNTGVRLPFSGTDNVWDYYDSHYFHWRSKSWKDQTKARKQWAKHKSKGEKCEDKWTRYDRELTMLLAEGPDDFSEEAA